MEALTYFAFLGALLDTLLGIVRFFLTVGVALLLTALAVTAFSLLRRPQQGRGTQRTTNEHTL